MLEPKTRLAYKATVKCNTEASLKVTVEGKAAAALQSGMSQTWDHIASNTEWNGAPVGQHGHMFLFTFHPSRPFFSWRAQSCPYNNIPTILEWYTSEVLYFYWPNLVLHQPSNRTPPGGRFVLCVVEWCGWLLRIFTVIDTLSSTYPLSCYPLDVKLTNLGNSHWVFTKKKEMIKSNPCLKRSCTLQSLLA